MGSRPSMSLIAAFARMRSSSHTRSVSAAAFSYSAQDGSSVTLQLINPEDLPTPSTYTHVVVATGTRMVFIAGQEPEDVHGNLVGPGDLAAQARQVYANLGRALTAAGARPEQVTKITIYVVHHRPEHLPVIERARKHLFGDHKPADTVVGVETLAGPGYLIEVDAIAVTDR
jgi:enamine deaminase RidA (YjgF/YER057c/UK114 family)